MSDVQELITDPDVSDPSAELIDLGVADDVIAGLRGRLQDLEANTPVGYEAVRAGIAEVRKVRTGVEKSRKALKQSALEWGRKVDAEAKRVTTMLLDIEEPLKERKQAVDDARAQAKMEAEQAARAEREKLEAIEREKQRLEQEAERERIEQERQKLIAEEAEHEKKIEAARAKIAEERAALEAEKAAMEAEKLKAIEEAAAKEAAARAEAERVEREKREAEEYKARTERELAERREREKQREAARIEAERLAEERKPDKERLNDLAAVLSQVGMPTMKTDWGKEQVEQAERLIGIVIAFLRDTCNNADPESE